MGAKKFYGAGILAIRGTRGTRWVTLRSSLTFLATILTLAATSSARGAPSVDPKVQARADFVRGADLVKDASWAEALSAFEASYARMPHAVTRFNMGICERALGKLTRAIHSFRLAIEDPALPAGLRADAQRFLVELDAAVVRVDMKFNETPTVILLDGSPLARDRDGWFVAGLLPPGPPPLDAPLAPASFSVIMDPGPHVLVAQRSGFRDLTHRASMARGSHIELSLSLLKADGLLRISSDTPNAVVTIDGVRLGEAPVELRKLAGNYRVAVTKLGFVTYRGDVRLAPGATVEVRARLQKETVPITRKWWFWTVASVAVAGVVATTFVLARPAPEAAQPTGGTLGWIVRAP